MLQHYDKQKEHKLFTFAFDWQLAAIFFGIGTAASTYPCLWCVMPKKDFAIDLQIIDDFGDLILKGGKLRSIGDLRKLAQRYNEAKAKHTGKNKLPSIDYFSVENEPIDTTLPDETLVLHVLAPMQLHLKHGLVNETFDLLDRLLENSESSIRASEWSNALGLEKTGHLGGKLQFNGGDCHKLLFSIDKLLELLVEHSMNEICEPIMDVFKAFQRVVNSCFGVVLYASRYKDDIRFFAMKYAALMEYCRQKTSAEKPIKLNVIPKVHAIIIHIIQFIEYQKTQNMDFGIGFHSEQQGKDYLTPHFSK